MVMVLGGAKATIATIEVIQLVRGSVHSLHHEKRSYLFKEEKSIDMRKKGIAIQTILLLLVGILVVGIIVYMVYRYFVGAPLNEQECRARAITWCTGCKNAGWTGGTVGSDLDTCADSYFPGMPDDCDAEDWCAAFIPV